MSEQSTQWSLENVEQSHRQSARTFHIPSAQERRGAKPGNLVRLHFLLAGATDCRAERMWVRIKSVLDVRFRGELVSASAVRRDLSPGEEIVFEPRHIATILISRDDPRWI